MSATCCSLHTTTCGHLDVCCPACPTNRETHGQLLLAALLGSLLLILAAVAS